MHSSHLLPYLYSYRSTTEDHSINLLLQLGDEFLLVVQLISEAADLLLVSFTVGVNLLLHRFLNIKLWLDFFPPQNIWYQN